MKRGQLPLLSDQVSREEVEIICSLLEDVLRRQVTGGIVELGCYVGTTSVFLAKVLQDQAQARPFHVYDSFEGLPPKDGRDASPAGTQFVEGELKASKAAFVMNFKKSNLPLPVIHKAWFSDLVPDDLPNPVAFAFLDGDYYQSIYDSLRALEYRLAPGSVIVVDDYLSSALPGAKKALDEWLARTNRSCQVRAGMAVVRI